MASKNKDIHNTPLYCYAKHYTHFYFFEQLISKAFPESTTNYFTDNIPLYLYIKVFAKNRVNLIPIFSLGKGDIDTKYDDRTSRVLRWESSYMQKPLDHVTSKYDKLKIWFASNMVERGISFCWSGNNTESHAFGQVAKKLKHATYFGEITNYPQTVYLDRHGTNYFSELVKKIDSAISEQLPATTDEIELLKNLKQGQRHIPQASLEKKVQAFIALYGIQQFLLSSGKRFNVWYVFVNKLKSYQTKYRELVKKGEFVNIKEWSPSLSHSDKIVKVLVPLQVNHDTQLHVFSDFTSSFDYIQFILSIIDDQTEVHIKLHPAEKKETNELTAYLINEITKDHPNIQLIKTFDFSNYDAVATINSTFGIDALLSGCKVITFGQSLYSDFDFVLHYGRSRSASMRAAIETYDDQVNPESFKYFAKTIQEEFYNFNYFGDRIDQGISEESLLQSINRLQEKIKSSLSSNHKK